MMRWRRMALRLLLGVAGFAAFVAVAGYGLLQSYIVNAPKPGYPKPQSLAEAQRDDLDYLRKLPWLDWSYTSETRAEAERIIDEALKRPFPLSRGEFELVLARVNSVADNGHTNVWGNARANRLDRLPIRVYSFADGVFIVRALAFDEDLLGAKILAVDGHPIETVAKAVSVYTGGTADEKNVRLPFYVESPDLLHAAGMANAPDRETLTMLMPDGATRSRLLVAQPPNAKAVKVWPSGQLMPVANDGQSADWIPALKGKADNLLMFAADPKPFYDHAIRGRRAYYVRFETNNDGGGMSISDFAKGAFARAVAARPDIVIVDLRMNGGGDYTTAARFMRGLPLALPHARFYILTSQETFSAGMTSAAFLKQAAGARGIFVGSPPGDRMRFRSEGGDFCLPFSGACMGARTAVHDYSERLCTPLFSCYPLDWLFPVAIKGFGPDISAPLTYAALSSGHDPALDAIFARHGLTVENSVSASRR